MLAFGVIIPVLPHLIEEFNGGNTVAAAMWVGLISTLYAASQFLCSPLQGVLSDRFGRRPVILLSNLGLAIDFVLLALAPSLAWLIVARLLSGATAASISTAYAYVADITPAAERAGRYGLLGSAFGLGFIIGPALGGILGEVAPRLPFWVAAALAFGNFCYGWLILPESLPVERRTSVIDWRRANPLNSLAMLVRLKPLLGLASVSFLSQFAHYALPSTFVLYASYRFGWGEREVGLTLAAVGVANALVQMLLVKRVVTALGEFNALSLGLIAGIVGFLVQGLATSGIAALGAIPFLALWGLVNPSLQSLLSQRVDPSEQGRLQGSLSSLIALGGIFAPTVFAQIFALYISPAAPWAMPGASFVLAALLLAAALIIAAQLVREPAVARA